MVALHTYPPPCFFNGVGFRFLFQKIVDRLSAQVAGRLNFEYKDPTKNFDRSRVKGLVAKLVQVKDPAHSTALEVAAGGRLYQVWYGTI